MDETRALARAKHAQEDVLVLALSLMATVGKFGWLRATPSAPAEEWLANAARVKGELGGRGYVLVPAAEVEALREAGLRLLDHLDHGVSRDVEEELADEFRAALAALDAEDRPSDRLSASTPI